MNSIYVLDTCALIAVSRGEAGADVVAEAYRKASSGEAEILINRVNLLEIYYVFYRYKGKEYANAYVKKIMQSIVKVSDFDESLFEEAGRLKALYRISLADSVALAQTIVTNGELLTADHHELDEIERVEQGVKFQWIR